jgi:hypothetical protein
VDPVPDQLLLKTVKNVEEVIPYQLFISLFDKPLIPQ